MFEEKSLHFHLKTAWQKLKSLPSAYTHAVLLIGMGLTVFGLNLAYLIHATLAEAQTEKQPLPQEVVQQEVSQVGILTVEVSGAVNLPGVYAFPLGGRVGEAVQKAGGFFSRADHNYIYKKLNLAKKLEDGEKIYIPFSEEELSIPEGTVSKPVNTNALGSTVSINTATLEEIDQLPGVGEKRASEIVQNRPYSKVEDLLTKKILPENIFNDVKAVLTL